MQHAKKVLAMLLAIVLAMGLSMPATAEEEGTSTQSEGSVFVIGPARESLPYGESFTLSAQIIPPEGMEAVAYQWWYRFDIPGDRLRRVENAIEPELTVLHGEAHYPIRSPEFWPLWCVAFYRLEVIFVGWEPDGSEFLSSIRSRSFEVAMRVDFVETPQKIFPYGANIVFDVSRKLPAGVEASYEWWVGTRDTPVEGITGSVLVIPPDSPHYPPQASRPYHGALRRYGYQATFTVRNEQGEVIDTFSYTSSDNYLRIEPQRGPNFFERIWLFIYTPIEMAMAMTVVGIIMSMGAMLPFTPLIFIGAWIFSVYAMIRGIVLGLF